MAFQARGGTVILTCMTIITTCVVMYQRHEIKKLRKIKTKEETETKEEVKTKSKSDDEKEKVQPPQSSGNAPLSIVPVGHVQSIYQLCVGTPRQGLLAPHARARIHLDTSIISPDSLLDLEDYSHVWILFVFHLNTTSPKKKAKNGLFPSRISPPALGGKRKVGIFATRTPHRPNPVGVTLARLSHVDFKKGILHLRGVDLVNGTPILDIKPYVSRYDSVSSLTKIPSWVEEGLEKRREVVWDDRAVNDLKQMATNNQLEFYSPEEWEEMKSCIEEVLAVDVRSVYQTKKARKGRFQAEKCMKDVSVGEEGGEGLCTQQLDNLLIFFSIQSHEEIDMDSVEFGSGSGDLVQVKFVRLIDKKLYTTTTTDNAGKIKKKKKRLLK